MSELPIAKADSWQMFNRIAGRYDLLNRLLSLGLDRSWRARLGPYLPAGNNLSLLDLATGTGDVPLILVRANPRIARADGLDLAEGMLAEGRRKIQENGLGGRIELSCGDAAAIPFGDDHFDAVTMAFGIRNVDNPVTVLKDIFRVLKPGGRALILEFSRPGNPLLRLGNLVYLRTVVPLIGGIISGDWSAYRYLNRTIEQFPYGERFCRMMEQVGLTGAAAHNLLGGTAAIYTADKPGEGS